MKLKELNVKWAYRSTIESPRKLKAKGLQPQTQTPNDKAILSGIGIEGPVIWFAESEEYAERMNKEGTIVRFPWPTDAAVVSTTQGTYVTQIPVKPQDIQIKPDQWGW